MSVNLKFQEEKNQPSISFLKENLIGTWTLERGKPIKRTVKGSTSSLFSNVFLFV